MRTTKIEGITKRPDQNDLGGSTSNSWVLCGTAQARKGGYIIYAQIRATIDPSTPPKPSSRSGWAWTMRRLPKPRAAQIIDQNDAGNVMRSAALASPADSVFFRPANVCQLKVM